MFLRLVLFALMALATLQPASAQRSADIAVAAAAAPRRIMTWVPPYAIGQSKVQLNKLYGGFGPRNGLTHLGLQFWTVNARGTLARVLVNGHAIPDATVQWFVNWAHTNHIKVYLCVFNAASGEWDWPLARNAFANHRTTLVKNITDQVTKLGLDGVDVDLENPTGNEEAVDSAYVNFVIALARALHQLPGRAQISVDSFAALWNAPNWNWWATLFPYVDGLNSMGYEDLGRNPPSVSSEPWRSYPNQVTKAGNFVARFSIGLPSYLGTWQGNTTLQQIQWFQTAAAGRSGIAIWDAQLQDSSWQTAAVWQALNYIRTH